MSKGNVLIFLALERAVTFSEKQELPSNWEREELLGTDEEDFSDEEEVSSSFFGEGLFETGSKQDFMSYSYC